MVSSSSIQDSDNAPANQNPMIVTNETHNQVNTVLRNIEN